MIRGTTNSGFDFEIQEEALDDWELVKLLTKLDEGDVHNIVYIGPLLLGNEQFEKLENYLKSKNNGKLRASTIIAEIAEILASTHELKN